MNQRGSREYKIQIPRYLSGEQISRESITGSQQKTFRIPPGSLGAFQRRGRFEGELGNLMQQYGFTLVEGEFDRSNLNEIGLHSRASTFPTEYERNVAIAQEANVTLPYHYNSPLTILETDETVIAKLSGMHGGFGKFLLDSFEKKAKFLIFTRLVLDREVESRLRLRNVLNQVNAGDINELTSSHPERLSKHYNIETFIQPPLLLGDEPIYGSIRIIADAFGYIHFGYLAWSEKNDIQQVKNISNQVGGVIGDIGVLQDKYLLNPYSPLYIESHHVVSNFSRHIMLDGSIHSDPKELAILHAYGLTSQPVIPDELANMASRVGIACRGDNLFVGVDFLNGFFLESNSGPAIRQSYLFGLPHNTSQERLYLTLSKRVLENASTHSQGI